MSKGESNNTEQDADLWFAFRKGNQQAFSRLYKKHYRSLYSYGKSMGMDALQVQDSIHDIFLKLYLKPDLIQSTTTLRAFLFQSIKNQLINIAKKEGRLIAIDEMESHFSFSYRLDEEIVREEEQTLIRQKIDKLLSILSPRQREIVYLRFLHEMEYDEISRVMNITQQGARNLLHKAMEKLREKGQDTLFFFLLCIYHMQ